MLLHALYPHSVSRVPSWRTLWHTYGTLHCILHGPSLPLPSWRIPSHPLALARWVWGVASSPQALLANKKSKRSSRDETKRKMNENDYVVPVGGSVRHGDYMRRYHAEAEEIKYREITPSEAEEIDEKETNR